MQVSAFRSLTFFLFLGAATFMLFFNFSTPIVHHDNGGDTDATTLIAVGVSRKLKENESERVIGGWVSVDEDYSDANPPPNGSRDKVSHGSIERAEFNPKAPPPPPGIYY
ncbi:hypothetical protein HN51_053051 [Arachis hypogaea]|uniref:uncharacterized protein LOC107608524 n=1 Tax=Arachis ipaensis TaxID=130454 RepID=UPI0007AF888E|nr:uncharacterized protein LOC107608524 [Arachis ipaensis]XP_025668642.1 uncharacterized protein LOC112766967 [Arachis hypogaea]QHN94481.1 uncharacterized protein DS421_17g601570 [Arachis hypogaea]